MKVTVILKGMIDQYGKQPLQIRINDGKARRFHPTGVKLLPAQWDAATATVKPTHPDHKEINRKLRLQVFQHEAGAYRDEPQKNDIGFYPYCLECFNEWDKTKSWETLREQRSKAKMINDYAPGLLLSDITPEWLRKYKTYLHKQGDSSNTVWGKFKFLHVITAKALKEKLIKEDPFTNFDRPKYRNPKRTFLTEDQVAAIDKVGADSMQRPLIRHCATWFVISCYTGLRYGDMAAFDKGVNIRAGRLVVETEKTKEMVSFALPEEVTALFERVGWKPLGITNQGFNRMLKQIAAYAGIKETIHAHVSRHTFGTLALSKGVPIEYVQKMLGHTDLKTTQIYAKIIDKDLDNHYLKMVKK